MTHYAGDGPWYPAIRAKLTSIAEGLPQQPDWYQQWLNLVAESSAEDRLRVYQAVRDAGVLPADAGFYLVTWHIDAMSSFFAETELRDLEDRMNAIERQHGLAEDEFWLPDEAPAEYEQVRQQYQAAWDGIFIRLLEHFGEWKAAELFEQDREGFERRTEVGREYFHGPMLGEDTPRWLEDFVAVITDQMTADSPMGPLKIQCGQEEGFWEVVVSPTPIELVGGAQDGKVVMPGFSLDMEGLRAAFDSVAAMGWQSLGLALDDGPYVFVEGVCAGNDVYLQVMAFPPENDEPSMKLDVNQKRSEY